MRESIDKIWEEIHSTQEWGQYPSEHIIRFIARNFYSKERSKIRILDFGCGGGAHTWYLAREGFDTYAFDGSKSAVEKTKLKLKREGLKADVKVYDALNIEYPDDYFNAVVDNLCTYANLVDDIKRMYKDIYSKLIDGGKFISVVFGKQTLGFGSGDEIEDDTFENIEVGALKGRGRVHFWDENALKECIQEIGFTDICIENCVYTDSGNKVEMIIVTATKR